MKIAVNGEHLTDPHFSTGLRRYVENLLSHLAVIDRKNTYYIFCPSTSVEFTETNFHLMPVPLKKRTNYADVIVRSREYGRLGCDLLFLPHIEYPKGVDLSMVLPVVHDLIPTLFLTPRFLLRGKTSVKLLTTKGVVNYIHLKRHAKKFKRIIAVSQPTKQTVGAFLGRRWEERITVIHAGVDPGFNRHSGQIDKKVVSDYGLFPGRYLIYFGGLADRKNLGRTVRAYRRLPIDLRQEYPFVIVGEGYWKEWIIKKGFTEHLRFVSTVSDHALAKLVSGAALSIYPSLLEGFGLPILESIGAGTLPLVSRIPSSLEITGPDFPTFDPYSVSDIQARLLEYLSSREKRENTLEKYRGLPLDYSWSSCASELVDVFHQLFRKQRSMSSF